MKEDRNILFRFPREPFIVLCFFSLWTLIVYKHSVPTLRNKLSTIGFLPAITQYVNMFLAKCFNVHYTSKAA